MSVRVTAGLILSLCLAWSAWAQERSIRFKLVNASEHVIRQVYVSPSSNPRWGEDLLEGKSLEPGKRRVLRFLGACGSYDLRLVADGGVEYLKDDMEFCDDDDEVTVGTRDVKKSTSR